MEQIALLIPWLQSNKFRFWEEQKIRRLLAAQTPETTAILVRSALWNATGRNDDVMLVPSKYEEVLKRDLFLTVRYLSDCKVIEPILATEIADALAAICLNGEESNEPSPLLKTAWSVLAKVKTNTIGPLVFAQFQRALDDERWSVQLNAAKALGQAEQDVTVSLDVVHAILQSSDIFAKCCAANSLKVVGQGSENIIALLIAAVKKRLVCLPVGAGLEYHMASIKEGNERHWRSTSAEVLGLLKPSRPEIVPVLIEALHDDDFTMRVSAARALGTVGELSNGVIEALILALPDPSLDANPLTSVSDFGNNGAAEALGQLTAKFPSLQAKMLALLKNDSGHVRGGAARALGYASIHSAELLDALSSAAQDMEWPVRYQALEALARIGKSNDRIVNVCLKAVDDPEWTVKSMAIETMGKVKPASEKGKAALLNAANSHPHYQRLAAEAFGHLGDRSLEIITLLCTLLNSEDTAVEAAATLVKLGRESEAEHRALLEGLQHEYEEVRLRAAEVMANLQIISPEIEKGLVDALQDRDEEVNFAAWKSLWTLMQRQIGNLLTRE